MYFKILILGFLIEKSESNPIGPAAVALNTIKSGARLAGKALRNKAVRRIKSGGEHIGAAIGRKKKAKSFFDEIREFFKEMNS